MARPVVPSNIEWNNPCLTVFLSNHAAAIFLSKDVALVSLRAAAVLIGVYSSIDDRLCNWYSVFFSILSLIVIKFPRVMVESTRPIYPRGDGADLSANTSYFFPQYISPAALDGVTFILNEQSASHQCVQLRRGNKGYVFIGGYTTGFKADVCTGGTGTGTSAAAVMQPCADSNGNCFQVLHLP